MNIYPTVSDFLNVAAPSEPVFCYWPAAMRRATDEFVSGFPGRVLYAVKCNPDRNVLTWLYEGGVRHFDIASVAEVELIHELFPDATCYFNHPVKSREALRIAHDLHAVRDFVVDHDNEFDKLLEVLGSEILVQVRLAIDNPDASKSFGSHFGVSPDAAVALLKRIHGVGANTALSFHAGSQNRSPQTFADAMGVAKQVLDRAGVPVRYLNVGGGFPADYGDDLPEMTAFHKAIRAAHARLGEWTELRLYSEPGRALVASGMAVLTQVHLRKADRLFINDGRFGSLSELPYLGFAPPAIGYGRNRVLRGEPVPFRLCGPTCDPTDEMPVPFSLPDDIDEGDWVLIERMGAYSSALVSDFNGFGARTSVVIEREPASEFEDAGS